MAFTYDAALGTDLSLVRFHIGDTNEEGYFLEDATITYWLTQKGSVGGAAIACLRYMITQANQPNFKLDWLSVTNTDYVKMLQTLLKQKAQEFGLSATGASMTSTVSNPTRADSDQEGDY